MFEFLMWLGVGTVLVVMWESSTHDDSDEAEGKPSGLRVFTDHRTGLQYLQAGFFGGLVPRLGANGHHLRKQDDVAK